MLPDARANLPLSDERREDGGEPRHVGGFRSEGRRSEDGPAPARLEERVERRSVLHGDALGRDRAVVDPEGEDGGREVEDKAGRLGRGERVELGDRPAARPVGHEVGEPLLLLRLPDPEERRVLRALRRAEPLERPLAPRGVLLERPREDAETHALLGPLVQSLVDGRVVGPPDDLLQDVVPELEAGSEPRARLLDGSAGVELLEVQEEFARAPVARLGVLPQALHDEP